MKLIIYSLISGVLGLTIASTIIRYSGNQVGDFIVPLLGIAGFFSPGLYTIDKICENSKK